MNYSQLLCLIFVSVLTSAWLPLSAAPILNEIFYHPPGTPEELSAEFIELYNPTDAEIDLTGWRFTKGISFTFADTSIPAGGYLVVAADVEHFTSTHPDIANVVGPWVGKLSNSGENIRLADADNNEVFDIAYADNGEWSVRERGPMDFGHQGWDWRSLHDGEGRSLELIRSDFENTNPQNWAPSAVNGGTPGGLNSAASIVLAPTIREVQHTPVIPNSSESVVISARVKSADSATLTVTLRYQIDEADIIEMEMDPIGGALYQATVPAQLDESIVAYSIEATDGSTSRAIPAFDTEPGDSKPLFLYQVDSSFASLPPWRAGDQPRYRIIITERERQELARIGTTASEADTNAQMNATFISQDGAGIQYRYLVGIRNRGASSRLGSPNNHLVNFRNDDPWRGVTSIKLNVRQTHSQVLGSVLFDRAGIITADAIPVKLTVNGDDLADPMGPRMYGSYARVETYGGEFTDNHYPNDPDGNLYQIRDDEVTGEQGDLRYEGEDPIAYQDTYFKQTNASADDWSDLIALTWSLNESPEETFLENVRSVLDLDQWLRCLAMDALLGNIEGGLTTAKGDDYALYRGMVDTRFRLVPHDLDSLMGQSSTPNPGRSIHVYQNMEGLRRLLGHPEVMALYYATHLDLLENVFHPTVMNATIDRTVGDWLPSEKIAELKQYVLNRRAGVLAQIPQLFSIEADLPIEGGFYRTDTEVVHFSGNFPAATVKSLRLNGALVFTDPRNGVWESSSESGDGILKPGINRMTLLGYASTDGTGPALEESFIDVWYADGNGTEVSGALTPSSVDSDELVLKVRDSYYPGVPVLARVEWHDTEGALQRERWDSVVTLSVSEPGVEVVPNRVSLSNGIGSALVRFVSGGGDPTHILIETGSLWRYLDDGSDQGTAWRVSAFDDSQWPEGFAKLGYGEGDEATEISYGPDEDQKYPTAYFRRRFEKPAGDFANFRIRIKYDDAAAIYINGVEAVRTPNLTPDATYADYATEDVPDEDAFTSYTIPSEYLHEGENTIAVEVHQGDGESSDLSFDLELAATTASTDVGSVTLTASGGGRSVSRSLRSLSSESIAEVSGELTGSSTTWSGVVHLTEDVTVPPLHTLTINPGTLVLIDGNPSPLSTNGVDLRVQGKVVATGTADEPITFTARYPDAAWGMIHHDHSEPSNYKHVVITRAGHSPRGGHTNTGSAVRMDNSTLSLEDVSITDIAGKIMRVEGDAITFDRCLLSRATMGPEIDDASVLMQDSAILEMRGIYREDGITDDDDGIYLHSARPGDEIRLLRTTIAHGDDDACDTLGSDVLIQDCIFRDFADKGLSVNGGSVSVERNLHVNNAIGIQVKEGDARLSLSQSTLADNPTGILALTGTQSVTVHHSIISASEDAFAVPETPPAQVSLRYSLLSNEEEGEGLLVGDPLFANPTSGNYHLQADSPARDAGDPSAPRDSDGSLPDLGRYPFNEGDVTPEEGTVHWLAADGPYRIVDDVVVPEGVRLIIEQGTSIYVEAGKVLFVEGVLQAIGTSSSRITFAPDPSAPWVPDFREALPVGPPKWGGIRFVDSMSEDNILSHVDIAHAQDMNGSVGIIRSQVLIEYCTFAATYLRMVYADSSSVRIEYCRFPDMFAPDERADELGLDNISEQIKGIGAYPPNGHFIIRGNHFGTNKGHNDIIDVDSGQWPNPILQIRDNVFDGAGDELLDLGGDVYVEGNLFRNVFKDDENSDRGYANAISTGDIVSGSTIVAVRNVFYDVDHAVNLKNDVSVIFEHNTVLSIHDDFDDRFGNPNVGSVINLFVDEPGGTPGGGAYLSGNVLMDLPRVFGNIDQPQPRTSPLVFHDNLVDPTMPDFSVGNRPGSVFDLGAGNRFGHAAFADPDQGDFTLLSTSNGRLSGPFGHDFGATAPAGAWIAGEPPTLTSSREATLSIGGAGIFAYRYRINEGEWSQTLPIGYPTAPFATLERRATLHLADLDDGDYVVSVIGQDFAGEWQDEENATQSRMWTVGPINKGVMLNEILAQNQTADPFGGDYPDAVELFNHNSSPVDLSGWSLSDDAADPRRYVIPAGTELAGGAYLIVLGGDAGLGFSLSDEGETLALYDGEGDIVDQVTFGLQVADYSIGRSPDGEWHLNQPTFGDANVIQSLGDASGVMISEWLSSPGTLFEEAFVELHNPDPLPISLEGLRLTDRLHESAHQRVFGNLDFLVPNGYRRFRADQGSTGDHLPFTLNESVGSLYLIGASGALQDTLQVYNETDGVSLSRNVTTGQLVYQSLPTPGLANDYDSVEVGRANALLRGLRISEIMFHAQGGNVYDFIELRNVGSVTLHLEGVRFVEGIRFVCPERTLAPGQAIVIVSDLEAFVERYGSDIPVLGVYEGNLSNEGERLTLRLPKPFEANILRFRYEDYWVPGTGGEGYSLVLREPAFRQGAAQFASSSSWTVSEEIGGSPSDGVTVPPISYAIWSAEENVGLPEEDPDHDGVMNLIEYALQMNPNFPDGESLLGIDSATKRVHVREHFTRPDVHYILESSALVDEWKILAEHSGPETEWIPQEGIPFETENGDRFVRLRFVLVDE